MLALSELFDWIGSRSAWTLFHGLDLALLLLALIAAGVGAAVLAGRTARWPIAPGQALVAAGAIATTVVLIFLDTARAEAGAFLGLAGALAILAGGLLCGEPRSAVLAPPPAAGAAPPPPGFYPDPRAEARLREWDGAGWTERTSD